MKTLYYPPLLEVERVDTEQGIAMSDASQFDLIINGFGDEQDWDSL